MNAKKTVYRIGLVPIILILTVGLFAAVPVLAEEVEPQVVTLLEVEDPGTAYNDGTGVLSFTWEVSGWPVQFGTATYYEFQILDNDVPKNVLYSQRSDPPSGDFTTPINDLQDVAGKSGEAGEEIYHPEYGIPDTHDWTVPMGLAEGQYSARVLVHLTDGTQEATTNIYIMEATGDLTVYKENYDTGLPLSGWYFDIDGPVTQAGGPTDSNGFYTFSNLPVGDYDVSETIQSDYVCVDIYDSSTATHDGSPSDGEIQDVTVIHNDTVVVEFYNQPDVGNLVVHKITDPSGSESGWTFSISKLTGGSYNDSGTTDGSGTYTFSGIPTGTYRVTETLLDSSWVCTDPGAGLYKDDVVSIGQTTDVYFTNEQKGSLIIYKYNDMDGSGTNNAGDTPWAGFGFQVSGVGGTFYSGSDGYVTVPNLDSGYYTVTEVSGPTGIAFVCTDPGSGKTVSNVYVPAGGSSDVVMFGNQEIIREVPTLSQWGIIGLSAAFVALLVWFGLRRRRIA
jgi:hypothetical protein